MRVLSVLVLLLFVAVSVSADPIPLDDDYDPPDYDEDIIEYIYARGDGSACIVLFISELSETKYRLERIGEDGTTVLFNNRELVGSIDGHRFVIEDLCLANGGYTYVLSDVSGLNTVELYRKFRDIDSASPDCNDTEDVCRGLVSAPVEDEDDDEEGCGCDVGSAEKAFPLSALMLLVGLALLMIGRVDRHRERKKSDPKAWRNL